MQVLASQLHFLVNRNDGQAISPLFWPVNCIKIGGHVALLSDPAVNCLYCAYILSCQFLVLSSVLISAVHNERNLVCEIWVMFA